MSKTFRESGLNLDDIHSFILRISINRAHGRGGRPYPRFQLEYVNEHVRSHFKSLEEVCEQLTSQVEAIITSFDDMDVDD